MRGARGQVDAAVWDWAELQEKRKFFSSLFRKQEKGSQTFSYLLCSYFILHVAFLVWGPFRMPRASSVPVGWVGTRK